jgi:CheY-like chemotaxis protein
MDRVWFVDDLPENLEKFRENHGAHFAVTTFDKPDQVYQRISNNEYPDALLIDIFFYDSVDEARRVEKKVGELAEALQKTAFDLGLADHKYAAGITLIEQLYQHFGKRPPPFPIYAYTSKGPFLLQHQDWQTISRCGAEVLLKNRVTPESEWAEIAGDIELHQLHNPPTTHGTKASSWFMPVGLSSVLTAVFVLILGRLIRGTW